MFNWFKKKKAAPQHFPDNESAFAHAITIGYRPLIGALIPALVRTDGGLGRDGERTFLIDLAAEGGTRTLWTCTLKESADYPAAGNLVGFRIVTIASDLPEDASLIGYIACRLEPILVPEKGWVVSQSYTPSDLKPALHL